MSGLATPIPAPKRRLESLDAFRGFTILGMIFVIAVAAGRYQLEKNGLPQSMSWFGSLPVSTWFHAEVGHDLWESTFKSEQLTAVLADPAFMPDADGQARGLAATKEVERRIAAAPEANLKGIGVTFTDLIAPWFVFIVGVVIPIGRRRDADEYYKHALWRTLMLVGAGILYMALVLKQVSWWWGVLQAIGIAYLMAAIVGRFSQVVQWAAVFVVGFLNLALTELLPSWTSAFQPATPFGSLSNPSGNWFGGWIIHCLPWLSISYGTMAMIGVLVGNAVATKNDGLVLRRSVMIGALFTVLGYLIHRVGFATENYSLCFNKPIVTTSYAYFTAGLGAICFAAFYWIIDVKGWKSWAAPLAVFGVNPLLAYFLQIILRRAYESLGIIDVFNRVTAENLLVQRWAVAMGSQEAPAEWVLAFFSKAGYMGVFWGLVWTAALWAVVRAFNKRGLYWKL